MNGHFSGRVIREKHTGHMGNLFIEILCSSVLQYADCIGSCKFNYHTIMITKDVFGESLKEKKCLLVDIPYLSLI
jgi:hypothetical protein